MISSINDLAYLCNNHDSYLTPELIKQIDQLTHQYGSKFQCEKASLIKQVWKIIQNSQMFWQNTSLMLTQAQYDETKVQALLTIRNRVKNNWYFQDEGVRNNAKQYLCGEAQKYSIGQMTTTRRIYFRIINQIIVEILKYQWMGDWYNFLSEICQSIEQSPALAENYFDLLYVIFSQIFDEKERLTSEEVRRISEQIVTNYGKIQKAFQIYLVPDCPPAILKNAMIALDSLIEWIPAYNVYFGFLIDKLIHLLANQQNQIQTLNCLLTIVALPNDQILSQFPAKAYQKRMVIFLGILSKDRLKKNETTSSKTLTTALKFLEQMQKHIQQFGKEVILPSKNLEENYIKITHKIQEWAIENPAQKSEQFIIVLYRYIISIIKNEQDIQYLIGNVIQIAPCPYKSSFYQEQSIFKGFFGNEEQLELDRVNYLQLMKSLISNQEQQYFSYLNQSFNGDFTKPSKKKLRQLWKFIWNFYYFISVAQGDDKLITKVFTVINTLIHQQQKLQKVMQEIRDPTKTNLMLVCCSSFKLGSFLILSNRRCRNKNMLKDPFLTSIVLGLLENNIFVRGMIDIMSISYDILPSEAKELIHEKYMSQMVNRLSRVYVDQRYVEMVAIWLSRKKENMKLGLYMIGQILSYYKNNIIILTKAKINTKNVQQAQQKQKNLLKQMRDLLKLCITTLPYLKSEIVFEMYDFTPTIKQFVVISDLSGGGQDEIQFFQLTMKLFIANFAQLSVDQVSKNLQLLVKENFQIINFIFEVLKKQAVGQEILECMLNYLGSFIIHFAKWDQSLQDKISKITKIITQVFQYNYTYDMPGFSEFINKIVQCPIFSKLDGFVVSETLNKIFILASYQSEEKTLKAIQILKIVIGNSIDSTTGQSMLCNYILDFISSTYTIMIKIKSKEEQYIKEFSDVLFMSLIFVKSMKFKFDQNQTSSNLFQVYSLMTTLTKKIYPNYNEIFLSKIDKMLEFMIGLTNKQQFKEKSKDLVIVLMRGY